VMQKSLKEVRTCVTLHIAIDIELQLEVRLPRIVRWVT
jgi:hypothetical protein